jgi:CheY-like chemotaxis protein
MLGDDDLLFGDDERNPVADHPTGSRNVRPWNVLIVDDEEQVHAVTRMVLDDFEFKQIPLNFLSAYSAAEGREMLKKNDDIAVCLLDVVMESDNAGLELARWVRENLGNPWLRIILRTGQPGQAPERKVIVEYDINDYKEKSELTAQKLFSAMVTALRSYKDIMAIEASRRGLEKIIDASASLFQIRSMEKFLSCILMQIGSLLEMSVDSVLISAGTGERSRRHRYRVPSRRRDRTIRRCDQRSRQRGARGRGLAGNALRDHIPTEHLSDRFQHRLLSQPHRASDGPVHEH